MGRNPRLRHGPSRDPRVGRRRPRALHGMGVRHGTGAHRDPTLRHSRHPGAVRHRRARPRLAQSMNASLEWLSAFVDSGLSAKQMRDLITARVATVDAIETLRADLAPIVVGEVLTAERHPDSDHLWVTTVDAGGAAPLEVICGAPNVRVGVRYPFAPVGATMPGGMKIERRKIRGRVSNGMLCSARELGLGTEHEGILPLNTAAAPGTPLLDAVALGDTRLVVDVLPTRPDLLSHRGLAREIAAAVHRPLVAPDKLANIPAPQPDGGMAVAVEHPEDAPTYVAIPMRVRIAPSRECLTRRLAAVGG